MDAHSLNSDRADRKVRIDAVSTLRRRRSAALRTLTFLLIGWLLLGFSSTQAQQGPQPLRPSRVITPPAAADHDRVEENQERVAQTQSEAVEGFDVDEMLSPSGMSSSLKAMLLLTVLSLAPSILIMTTCFIRFVIVFGLLRQALGTQQLPPNQVITSLCLFLTLMVMAPVWQRSYSEGIEPYSQNKPIPGLLPGEEPLKRAFLNSVQPIREFMADQIEITGNSDTVWMLLDYHRPDQATEAGRNYTPPESYDEVPLTVLLPAYMISELKTAFIIGFQVYLPFLVIDMVVSSVLISMGMMMLPPTNVSLPFKLLLFIMIDGWYLTVGMLLESVHPP